MDSKLRRLGERVISGAFVAAPPPYPPPPPPPPDPLTDDEWAGYNPTYQAEEVAEEGAESDPYSSWDEWDSGEELDSGDELENTVKGLESLRQRMEEMEDWGSHFDENVRDAFENLKKETNLFENAVLLRNGLNFKKFTSEMKVEQARMEKMMKDMKTKWDEWEEQYEPVKDLISLPERMQGLEDWANGQYETVKDLISLPERMQGLEVRGSEFSKTVKNTFEKFTSEMKEEQEKIKKMMKDMQRKGVGIETLTSKMNDVNVSLEKIKKDYTSLIDKLEETFTVKKDRVKLYATDDPEIYDINYKLENGKTSVQDSLSKNTVKFATFFYQ